MGSNIDPLSDIKQIAQHLLHASTNSQLLADFLWTSGGKLNLKKCFYYAFHPKVNYKKQITTCDDIPLSDPVVISNPEDKSKQTIE
jgi:hypothetical protein